jgi:hypothetical protein
MSEADVSTARSPENVSEDIRTAREATSICDTSELHQELDSMVAVAKHCLEPPGVLAPDVQRSVTEMHAPQHQFNQTPISFDARASSSARNLGQAPKKQELASVEGDVKTASESSETNIVTARSAEDVKTVIEIVEQLKTALESLSLTNVKTAVESVEPAQEESQFLAMWNAAGLGIKPLTDDNLEIEPKDSETDIAQPVVEIPGFLQADVQRSVTEIHAPQHQLTQTPQAFDARASSSARNLGQAPKKQELASVEGDVKTAQEISDNVATARSPSNESSKENSKSDKFLAMWNSAGLGTKPITNENPEIDPRDSVSTARSPKNVSEDIRTAREVASQIQEPVAIVFGQLQPDCRRSVTEINAAEQLAPTTPTTFDQLAALQPDFRRSVTEVNAAEQLATQTPTTFDQSAALIVNSGVDCSSLDNVATARSPSNESSKENCKSEKFLAMWNSAGLGIKSLTDENPEIDPRDSVSTARSPKNVSEDIRTAREAASQIQEPVAVVFEQLQPDFRRSVTEVNAAEQLATQTATTFGLPANSGSDFSSLDNVATARSPSNESSKENCKSEKFLAMWNAAGLGTKPLTDENPEIDPKDSVSTARSPKNVSEDIRTAREVASQIQEPVAVVFEQLQPDFRRSVTEINASEQLATQTPTTFDQLAALIVNSGVNFSSLETQLRTALDSMASAEDVKTALESPSQEKFEPTEQWTLLTANPYPDSSVDDVKTAQEI